MLNVRNQRMALIYNRCYHSKHNWTIAIFSSAVLFGVYGRKKAMHCSEKKGGCIFQLTLESNTPVSTIKKALISATSHRWSTKKVKAYYSSKTNIQTHTRIHAKLKGGILIEATLVHTTWRTILCHNMQRNCNKNKTIAGGKIRWIALIVLQIPNSL